MEERRKVICILKQLLIISLFLSFNYTSLFSSIGLPNLAEKNIPEFLFPSIFGNIKVEVYLFPFTPRIEQFKNPLRYRFTYFYKDQKNKNWRKIGKTTEISDKVINPKQVTYNGEYFGGLRFTDRLYFNCTYKYSNPFDEKNTRWIINTGSTWCSNKYIVNPNDNDLITKQIHKPNNDSKIHNSLMLYNYYSNKIGNENIGFVVPYQIINYISMEDDIDIGTIQEYEYYIEKTPENIRKILSYPHSHIVKIKKYELQISLGSILNLPHNRKNQVIYKKNEIIFIEKGIERKISIKLNKFGTPENIIYKGHIIGKYTYNEEGILISYNGIEPSFHNLFFVNRYINYNKNNPPSPAVDVEFNGRYAKKIDYFSHNDEGFDHYLSVKINNSKKGEGSHIIETFHVIESDLKSNRNQERKLIIEVIR